jgi:hypothetical protein
MDYPVFERLVAQMSSEERKKLLQNIKVPAYNATSLDVRSDDDAPQVENLGVIFRTESLWLRIYLRITAMFKGIAFDAFYKSTLLQRIAKKVDKKCPRLLNWDKKTLGPRFNEEVASLKTSANYFYNILKGVESDPGNFYVFLGTFFMPIISERYKREVDPKNYSLDTPDITQLRLNLLKKLDKILDTMDNEKRTQMSMAVKSLNWVRSFCALPFQGFGNKFSSHDGECSFNAATPYIDQLAVVLCNGVFLQEELLKALFLYNSSDQEGANQDAGVFITNASEHIATIKRFMANVPLRSVGILIHASLTWTPALPELTRDWHNQFRQTWHTIFSREWDTWLEGQQRGNALAQFTAFTGATTLPLLPFRPWEKSPEIPCPYDLCLGFLLYFFQTLFPKYSVLLDHLLMAGTFPQRDYRSNLMDSIDSIQSQYRHLTTLTESLKPFGALGTQFREAYANSGGSSRKILALMQKVEDEGRPIVANCKKGCHALNELLEDIIQNFTGTTGGPVILAPTEDQGEFMRNMQEIRVAMTQVFQILKMLETVQVTSDDKPLEYNEY